MTTRTPVPMGPVCRRCGQPANTYSVMIQGPACTACHDVLWAQVQGLVPVCNLCKAKPANFYSAQLMGGVCVKCYVAAEVLWRKQRIRDIVLPFGRVVSVSEVLTYHNKPSAREPYLESATIVEEA